MKGRARKQKCYVGMYGVGGQELATTGEVELDVQIGTDIVRQKFIIADIQEEGIWGFDFFSNQQAEQRWAENELHLGTKNTESTSERNIGKVARITTRNVVIVPPQCEVVTSGIIQGKVGIPEVGMIQPQ